MLFKKIHYLLFTLIFFIIKVEAQFVGYYNLHDGGVDMPHSSLFVLPNNEFYIFYYGGYKIGKWNEVDKNNITLVETKTENAPISIYGKLNKNQESVGINVYGLYKSYALINFSKDTVNKKEFQPIFNDGANCLGDKYEIKKKAGEYNWITISIAADPDFGRNKTRYPYKALNYTFPLPQKYNAYVIVQNENALLKNMIITLTKKNDSYSIGGDRNLEKEDLTAETMRKIESAKRVINNETFKRNLGNKILSISEKKIVIYKKPITKPLFIVKCEDDEKVVNAEDKIEKRILPTADRINGFYTVLNFKEDEYDIKNYELSKEPSIKKDDILAVNKVVSEYGGYEIEIIFNEKGKLNLAELSKNNVRKPVAIVANRLIVSSPIFAREITGGKVTIAGGLSEMEIDEIIVNLKK